MIHTRGGARPHEVDIETAGDAAARLTPGTVGALPLGAKADEAVGIEKDAGAPPAGMLML